MVKSLGHLLKLSLNYLEPKNLGAKEKVGVAYRYISWFITSFYYLTDSTNYMQKYKVAVVVVLLIFSRLIMDCYLKGSTRKTIHRAILIETIALTLLLIPTGGLESPFIWYALNPVLIASNYHKEIYCWFELFFYLIASLLISFSFFNAEELTIIDLIREKHHIILVYILVTIIFILLSRLIKHLDQQAEELQRQRQELMDMNDKLLHANSSVKRSMEYVMYLYHIIETFSSRGDIPSVFRQIVDSAMKITESQGVFLWLSSYKDQPTNFFENLACSSLKSSLSAYLSQKEGTLITKEVPFTFQLENCTFLVSRVQSSSRFYGFIGIELSYGYQEWLGFKREELLSFLGKLVSLVLERHDAEKLGSKLMIIEEQNRIGNEIHDNVSQRLFSVLCGIHALNANWQTLEAKTISQQLRLIEQSIKETSKELRSSIYRLSSSKRGETIFKDNLKNYLLDFASLNRVHVNFDFQGDEKKISSNLKQALIRIVREGSGNAMRHGQCTQLEVSISIHAKTLDLIIKDNGKGFKTERVFLNRENRGLGLDNMQVLAQTFNGQFELTSGEDTGTELYFKFPLGFLKDKVFKDKGGAA